MTTMTATAPRNTLARRADTIDRTIDAGTATIDPVPVAVDPIVAAGVVTVQADIVFGAIDAYRELADTNADEGTPRYDALVREANDVFRFAFECLRLRLGFRAIYVATPLDPRDPSVPDITDLVVDEIHRLQRHSNAA